MQESLTAKTTELKHLNKEKTLLEGSLRDARYANQKLEAEIKAKRAKLGALAGRYDGPALPELQQKLGQVKQALAANETKVARYEKYIQAKLKKIR